MNFKHAIYKALDENPGLRTRQRGNNEAIGNICVSELGKRPTDQTIAQEKSSWKKEREQQSSKPRLNYKQWKQSLIPELEQDNKQYYFQFPE